MVNTQLNHNLVALIQVYNEEKYLQKWFDEKSKYITTVIAYDDGSTDSSREILKRNIKNPDCLIVSDTNAHHLESHWNNKMYERIREMRLKPDWVFCSGADEFMPDYPGFIDELNAIIDEANKFNLEKIGWKHAELWFHEHWYRVDSYYSQLSFMRLYRYNPEIKFSKEQLTDHPHCCTFPDYYNRKEVSGLVVQPYKMMTLHYGYMEKERIIARFERMAKIWEEGKFGAPTHIYYNWIRGVDVRRGILELKHLPRRWCNCSSCPKPEFKDEYGRPLETILSKDNPYYRYWEQFKQRRFTETIG